MAKGKRIKLTNSARDDLESIYNVKSLKFRCLSAGILKKCILHRLYCAPC